MKKSILFFSLIMMQILYFSVCFAEEDLRVSAPNHRATLANQVIDENRLLVSAQDEEGNPIRGLGLDDFIVEKGGKKAKIFNVEPFETSKEIGLNVVLVVDNSFSMDLRDAVEPLLTALEEFIKTVRPIDNIHVVVFDNRGRIKVKEHVLHAKTFQSNNVSEIRAFLRESFDRGLSSYTFLYEAMVAGLDLIRKMPEKSNKYLVVFSDGEDLNSVFRGSVVRSEAKDIQNFEAYCVDYTPGSSVNSFLLSFAKNHGGRIWKASSSDELIPIFQSFSTTLLHRYIVSYKFMSPPKGMLTMEPTELNYQTLTLTDGSTILNQVFFETGKSEIPRDYVLLKEIEETQFFDAKNLTTPLERYYNVLNILGNRLSQNPTVQVRIIGCNSGLGQEEGNLELSRKRAEAVKSYLNNIWAVDADRMEVGIRNLPTQSSHSDILGGRAENQRVDIEYDSETMRQGVADEFIVEANNANEIKVYPQIEAEYDIADWELNLIADNQAIKTLRGTGALKPFYSFSLDEFGRGKMATFQNVQVAIKVKDTNGDTHNTATAPILITSSSKEVIHELIHPLSGKLTLEPSTITIQELTTIDSSPMLNYVFFETGKSEIPERYSVFTNQADTKNFSEKKLKGTMEKYYHNLDVIGKRLSQFPEANIRLVGCNSNFGIELGRIDLSQGRAESVRAYLKYIWGIDPSRMTVEARNLPAAASNNKLEVGRFDNQRVEVYSDSPHILEPIKSTFMEETSDTEVFRVLPNITAGYGVTHWKIELSGDGAPIASLEGKGDLKDSYTFDLNDIGLQKIASFKEIRTSIEITDENDQLYRDAADSVVRFIKREEHIAQKSGYKVLEKYALVLFDFNSSYIKGQNSVIVDQIVGRMNEFPESDVEVVGHTDNIGREEYNLWLSERRAKSVFNQIMAGMANGTKKINHLGSGLHNPLYDNSLPEGRALNRTVTISLEYEKEIGASLTSININD